MPRPCLQPRQPFDTRYAHGGMSCTWHGPIADTAARPDGQPCCPVCGGALEEVETEDGFHRESRAISRAVPEYALLLDWSRGKCFPDFHTLENAWCQAMEGER